MKISTCRPLSRPNKMWCGHRNPKRSRGHLRKCMLPVYTSSASPHTTRPARALSFPHTPLRSPRGTHPISRSCHPPQHHLAHTHTRRFAGTPVRRPVRTTNHPTRTAETQSRTSLEPRRIRVFPNHLLAQSAGSFPPSCPCLCVSARTAGATITQHHRAHNRTQTPATPGLARAAGQRTQLPTNFQPPAVAAHHPRSHMQHGKGRHIFLPAQLAAHVNARRCNDHSHAKLARTQTIYRTQTSTTAGASCQRILAKKLLEPAAKNCANHARNSYSSLH